MLATDDGRRRRGRSSIRPKARVRAAVRRRRGGGTPPPWPFPGRFPGEWSCPVADGRGRAVSLPFPGRADGRELRWRSPHERRGRGLAGASWRGGPGQGWPLCARPATPREGGAGMPRPNGPGQAPSPVAPAYAGQTRGRRRRGAQRAGMPAAPPEPRAERATMARGGAASGRAKPGGRRTVAGVSPRSGARSGPGQTAGRVAGGGVLLRPPLGGRPMPGDAKKARVARSTNRASGPATACVRGSRDRREGDLHTA